MNKAEILVVAASLVLLPGFSCTAEWDCKPDVEVQRTSEACSVAKDQGTIPIGLSFDSHGTFSLCAYSGCWEGKGKVVQSRHFSLSHWEMSIGLTQAEGLKVERMF